MDTVLYKLAEWMVSTICDHPELAGAGLVMFVLCNLTVNGIRVAYPNESERPRWVSFWLGFLDLGALNVWRWFDKTKRPG